MFLDGIVNVLTYCNAHVAIVGLIASELLAFLPSKANSLLQLFAGLISNLDKSKKGVTA